MTYTIFVNYEGAPKRHMKAFLKSVEGMRIFSASGTYLPYADYIVILMDRGVHDDVKVSYDRLTLDEDMFLDLHTWECWYDGVTVPFDHIQRCTEGVRDKAVKKREELL